MSKYVIDASVAVKWVIEEVQHVEARRYLDETFTLIAPAFLLIECASAIQNKVRHGEIKRAAGWKSFEAIRDYETLKLVPTYDLLNRAYDIANDLGHPIYDCLYMALAEKENVVVVTADRRFYNRVSTGSFSTFIAWVEDQP